MKQALEIIFIVIFFSALFAFCIFMSNAPALGV